VTRFTLRRLYHGETRYTVCQNVMPREWPDLWHFSVHCWPFYFSISRSS
jgi:hypothetical protein